ncbi:hypothetical protein FAVG1_02631 [Fusarium avenaceum]|nr:hypothetical protein FAVG1_02631 [Fusarium avenaceum]
MPSKTDKTRNSPSPDETPDIIPSRQLTSKEAEEDYQKQLAMLDQQNKEYRQGQKSRVSGDKKTGEHGG